MRGAGDGEHVSSLESFITLGDRAVLSSWAKLLFQEAKNQSSLTGWSLDVTLTGWSLDVTVKHVSRLGVLGPLGLNVPDVSLSCGPSV